MADLGRIFVLLLAYALACVAASFVFTIGTFAPRWPDAAASDLPPPEALRVMMTVGVPIIGVIAFFRTILVIVIAEGFGWRTALAYAALGGGLALALSYGVHLTGDIVDAANYYPGEREVEAASGMAGGLVYWLIAGRKAGSWK
jgi:hypothetical protein